MFTYDLVDLRLFSAAARAGSVSQAASEVHLAVSSASARLKAFEARSGVKLFERRPHGVDLMPAGVETVHAVRAMLHDAEVLESVLTRFRRNHQEVCVAALPNAMTVGLADDVSAFLEQNPEVSIKLTNYARAGRLLDSVLNRTVTWPSPLGREVTPNCFVRRTGRCGSLLYSHPSLRQGRP